MASFQSAVGLCFAINGDLLPDSNCLPVSVFDEPKICDRLTTGQYTRLSWFTTEGPKQIRVSCEDGKIVVPSDHGFTIPAGTQLYFDWTEENLNDWADCRDEAAAEANPEEEDEDCCDDIDESELVWQSCNKEFYVKDGKVRTRPMSNPIPDGVYANATVTVRNGKVSFSKGCPVMSKGSDEQCHSEELHDQTCVNQAGV